MICQLRTHGDIIRTFPLIKSLKKTFPDAWIGATCFEDMKSTYFLCKDYLDEVIVQPILYLPINHFEYTRLINCEPLSHAVEKTREFSIDVYIDLHGVFQSALFGMLSNIPIICGRSYHTTKDGAHLFYNRIADIESVKINRMFRHFLIARSIFPQLEPIKDEKFNIPDNGFVAFVPGSSKKGILKRWPITYYADLINIISKDERIKVILGPEEEDLYYEILNLLQCQVDLSKIDLFSYYPKIFQDCKCVVGNDSAPLHISTWLNVPTFMILGPTSPAINSPWEYSIGISTNYDTICNGCDIWNQRCLNNHKCMNKLSVNSVYMALKKFLEKVDELQ